jgi:3-hydroxyacyl-CoA dehydrogenase, NAD binding domain
LRLAIYDNNTGATVRPQEGNMEAMSYSLPSDADGRPISVIGGGTLGRRIALMFSAGGSRVHLFSRSAGSREAARRFIGEHPSDVREQLGLAVTSLGTCSGRILGRWFDLSLWHRHDRHPCVSPWLTGCW